MIERLRDASLRLQELAEIHLAGLLTGRGLGAANRIVDAAHGIHRLAQPEMGVAQARFQGDGLLVMSDRAVMVPFAPQ